MTLLGCLITAIAIIAASTIAVVLWAACTIAGQVDDRMEDYQP